MIKMRDNPETIYKKTFEVTVIGGMSEYAPLINFYNWSNTKIENRKLLIILRRMKK